MTSNTSGVPGRTLRQHGIGFDAVQGLRSAPLLRELRRSPRFSIFFPKLPWRVSLFITVATAAMCIAGIHVVRADGLPCVHAPDPHSDEPIACFGPLAVTADETPAVIVTSIVPAGADGVVGNPGMGDANGSAGETVAPIGSIDLTLGGDISASGGSAPAISIFAVGGAGGNGGAGTSGGAGGAGAEGSYSVPLFIVVESSARISSADDDGLFIFATGGAGGNGGEGSDGGTSGQGGRGGDAGPVTVDIADARITAASVGVAVISSGGHGGDGSAGGDGGDGGTISIVSSAQIVAADAGIVAVSFGGAGGDRLPEGDNGAGGAHGAISITHHGAIDVSGVGGAGIAAVHQGACASIGCMTSNGIAIHSTGAITTRGSAAYGILAIADAAPITIHNAGSITALGDSSFGIAVESNASDVAIVNLGQITTVGDGAIGIAVESDANARSSHVSLALGGRISTSGDNAPAVAVATGGDMSISVSGVIATTGLSSSAIDATTALPFAAIDDEPGGDINIDIGATGNVSAAGADAYAIITEYKGVGVINNAGVVSGNVLFDYDGLDESASNARFNNLASGIFNAGDTIELAGYGRFSNAGVINPFGAGRVGTSVLNGDFTQSSTGRFGVDIDHAGSTADLLQISRAAVLSGSVVANLVTFDAANAEKTITILTADDGVTINGLAAVDTALIDYTLLYPDENTVQITLRGLSLNTAGLTPNQISVASYLLANGSHLPPDLAPVMQALFGATSQDAIAAIADQLYDQATGSSSMAAFQSGRAFAAALRSCPVAEGPYGQLRETSCVWATPEFRRFSQDRDADAADVETDTRALSGGFQAALADGVWGGLGFAIEDSDSQINGTTSSNSELWQVGAVVKWIGGPLKVSGSLSAGQGDIETARTISFPGVNAIASSNTDMTVVNGLLRVAYAFGDTGFYVTPMLDAGFANIRVENFTETGAGGLNLAVGSLNETIFSGGPAIEIGSTLTVAGSVVRPYVKAGVTFLSDDGVTTASQFAGAPAALSPFFLQSRFDDVFVDLSAGVQMFGGNGINMRVNYDGHVGENSDQHGFDAKLTFNY